MCTRKVLGSGLALTFTLGVNKNPPPGRGDMEKPTVAEKANADLFTPRMLTISHCHIV